MAHEITETDGVVLHERGAWHGLGTIVKDAPTPEEALVEAGIDWTVHQRPLYIGEEGAGTDLNESRIAIPDHVCNVRSDLPDGQNVLGITSKSFCVVQNSEVAAFCSDIVNIAGGDNHCIETAGSLYGGKRVWFLVKGKEVAIGNDPVNPYLLAMNGHDGSCPLKVIPVTVRVVCANTLHAALRSGKKNTVLSMSVKHTAKMADRIAAAKSAIEFYHNGIDGELEAFNTLAKHSAKVEDYQQFFLNCYTADFGDIPENPQTGHEENRVEKAQKGYLAFAARFDNERPTSGDNWWTAFNAYTGYIQHDRTMTGEDTLRRRAASNLNGVSQVRSQDAMKRAFAMLA